MVHNSTIRLALHVVQSLGAEQGVKPEHQPDLPPTPEKTIKVIL